ncbi:hypothetical protein B0H17DRAFT_1123899 [Mycena rosella]|uniref:Uncharacterized protein n=1 Tax=Mycena rosella TaxID=1033263 RepID=A0AAD7H387_MYCRO|nr:hypothetical protein B0H17DRAFT_1123899 [Mycena rosella]
MPRDIAGEAQGYLGAPTGKRNRNNLGSPNFRGLGSTHDSGPSWVMGAARGASPMRAEEANIRSDADAADTGATCHDTSHAEAPTRSPSPMRAEEVNIRSDADAADASATCRNASHAPGGDTDNNNEDDPPPLVHRRCKKASKYDRYRRHCATAVQANPPTPFSRGIRVKHSQDHTVEVGQTPSHHRGAD